ncbi:16S rRNA (cytidine(1402)-2'-O)-methyltransferase [Sulfitobacter aestuariivivens]|uniref:Ribosomal RNA small subunit methyltransferase I n=1 Tax=Sulfitobacter aestuariivivens TaxID=2766981 RepID=A0A927D6C2_9RHOB|nr:16S rRNA (cytidine(1402)-2'-O)-methyltransferase [Sulfitobacter aestuariivivens]MBD3665825.1 16S rRNA (cytidine(1402)-2'-O)-methyltransferase [Sulfitobacter aestuariivivens]
MNYQMQRLSAGLYLVGVPIGTARDITLRALDVLASADQLAAEDTRSLRKLMDIHGVPLGDRRVHALHDHSGRAVQERLLTAIREGQSVAYASEAGMPLIADPGFELVRAAGDAGLAVTSAPGPSAVTTALAVGGLPTDAFFFAGFLPNAKSARCKALEALRTVPGTLVFYESPKRVLAMLRDASDVLGPGRYCSVCRELTKKFEEVVRGSLEEVAEKFNQKAPKGEFVILIERTKVETTSVDEVDAALRDALSRMSMRDAVDAVSQALEMPRRKVYQMALSLQKDTQ